MYTGHASGNAGHEQLEDDSSSPKNYGALPTNGNNQVPPTPPKLQYLAAFTDLSVRQAFIQKMYAILGAQVVLTTGIVCTFMFVEPDDILLRSEFFHEFS